MKYLVLLFASLGLLVSSVSGFSTYVTTSGDIDIILSFESFPYVAHTYSGEQLHPGVNNPYVNLMWAKLHDASLRYANFQSADINHAQFYDADLRDVNFKYADLSDVYLYGADLSNADLRFATLNTTYLAGANLSNADLRFSDLTNAYDVDQNVNYTGTLLYGATLPGGKYDQAWFENAGADFDTVPEPSTYALLLGGTVLGYAFWRRRK